MDFDVDDILSPVFNLGIPLDEETILAGESAGIEPLLEDVDDSEQGCEFHAASGSRASDDLIDMLPEVELKHAEAIPLTGLDFNDSLTSATADVGIVPTLVQPWETGPMSQLFSKNTGLTALPKGLSALAGVGKPQQAVETNMTTAVAIQTTSGSFLPSRGLQCERL